jgi:hypothetical protein
MCRLYLLHHHARNYKHIDITRSMGFSSVYLIDKNVLNRCPANTGTYHFAIEWSRNGASQAKKVLFTNLILLALIRYKDVVFCSERHINLMAQHEKLLSLINSLKCRL